MRKRVYNIFLVMLLVIYCISLASCEAITAQNIHIIDSTKMANNTAKEPDAIGEVVSVNLNSIKVELVEQTQNDIATNSDDEEQDVKDDNAKVKSNPIGERFNHTGKVKTIPVSENVEIAQGISMDPKKNNAPNSSMKVVQLKKGQVIMVWYKEDTEIAERISLM